MLLTLAAASGAPVKVQHTRVNDAVARADHHESCENWAKSGECESNPGFMLINCNHSCAKLDLGKRQYAARCPTPANHTAALPPGVMHATFERVMSEFAELQPERMAAIFTNGRRGASLTVPLLTRGAGSLPRRTAEGKRRRVSPFNRDSKSGSAGGGFARGTSSAIAPPSTAIS